MGVEHWERRWHWRLGGWLGGAGQWVGVEHWERRWHWRLGGCMAGWSWTMGGTGALGA